MQPYVSRDADRQELLCCISTILYCLLASPHNPEHLILVSSCTTARCCLPLFLLRWCPATNYHEAEPNAPKSSSLRRLWRYKIASSLSSSSHLSPHISTSTPSSSPNVAATC